MPQTLVQGYVHLDTLLSERVPKAGIIPYSRVDTSWSTDSHVYDRIVHGRRHPLQGQDNIEYTVDAPSTWDPGY